MEAGRVMKLLSTCTSCMVVEGRGAQEGREVARIGL